MEELRKVRDPYAFRSVKTAAGLQRKREVIPSNRRPLVHEVRHNLKEIS
jgi:hypothetical protein